MLQDIIDNQHEFFVTITASLAAVHEAVDMLREDYIALRKRIDRNYRLNPFEEAEKLREERSLTNVADAKLKKKQVAATGLAAWGQPMQQQQQQQNANQPQNLFGGVGGGGGGGGFGFGAASNTGTTPTGGGTGVAGGFNFGTGGTTGGATGGAATGGDMFGFGTGAATGGGLTGNTSGGTKKNPFSASGYDFL